MNRKAKRNKFKNETNRLNIRINQITEEYNKYFDKWYDTTCELDKSKKEVEKYKDKFYEQLKKEFLDGSKQLLTVSVNVPRNILPCPDTIDKNILEQERRKYLCHEIAQYLYDNQQAFQVVEHDSYTRYNLVLVQNNPDKRGISEEDFNAMMERYGNKDIFDSVTKERSSNIRFEPIGSTNSPFMR